VRMICTNVCNCELIAGGVVRRSMLLLALATMLAVPLAAARAAEDSFTLSIKDHHFSPSELVIPAGKKVTVVVKNLDPTPEEFESIDLRREKVVAGGDQITVYIGPLRPGRYEFFGDFNPDKARGHIIAK